MEHPDHRSLMHYLAFHEGEPVEVNLVRGTGSRPSPLQKRDLVNPRTRCTRQLMITADEFARSCVRRTLTRRISQPEKRACAQFAASKHHHCPKGQRVVR